MVRAFASHQWGPASNPGVDAKYGLSLLLVLSFVSRGFFSWDSSFPLFSKINLSKFQFDQELGRRGTLFVDVLPPNHYYLLLTHRATTPFLWKSPLELFINRKPRIRLSGLRVKSSIEGVFKDNLDLTTKQRLSNPRKLVLGFWTSKSRPLSGIDIKNYYVHGSYLHLYAESYVASPVSKPSGSFSPRK